jgi:hypothetical protein
VKQAQRKKASLPAGLFFYQVLNIFGFELLIKYAVGLDQHYRTDRTESIAAGLYNFHLLGKPPLLKLFLQGLPEFSSPGGVTAGAAA